jgi:hypothetical protein
MDNQAVMKAAALHELSAAVHLQLESTLLVLRALSGAVYLRSQHEEANQWTDDSDEVALSPSMMERQSAETKRGREEEMESRQSERRVSQGQGPPLDAPGRKTTLTTTSSRSESRLTPRKPLGSLSDERATPEVDRPSTSGAGHHPQKAFAKSSKLLKCVAVGGSWPPNLGTVRLDAMMLAVLNTGIAIHDTSTHRPFICLPIPSTISFQNRIGVVVIYGKQPSEGDRFDGQDEATLAVFARAFGHICSRYAVDLVPEPYTAERLAPLRKSKVSQYVGSGLFLSGEMRHINAGQVSMSTRQQVFRTEHSGGALIRAGILGSACDVPDIVQLREISDRLAMLDALVTEQRKLVVTTQEEEQKTQERVKELQKELQNTLGLLRKSENKSEAFEASAAMYQTQLRESMRKHHDSLRDKVTQLTVAEGLDLEARKFIHRAKLKLSQQQELQPPANSGRRDVVPAHVEGAPKTARPPTAPYLSDLQRKRSTANLSTSGLPKEGSSDQLMGGFKNLPHVFLFRKE